MRPFLVRVTISDREVMASAKPRTSFWVNQQQSKKAFAAQFDCWLKGNEISIGDTDGY